MSTYVPDAVQAGLDAARNKRLKSVSKLRVETQGSYVRVLRLWDTGFSVALNDAPHLRGFVDLYEGPSHLWQCLIVASEQSGDEMTYEFKRMTAVSDRPPRDFEAGQDAPVALIGSAKASS
jgi:hypothetical protein